VGIPLRANEAEFLPILSLSATVRFSPASFLFLSSSSNLIACLPSEPPFPVIPVYTLLPYRLSPF